MMAVSHMVMGASLWAVTARASGLDPVEPMALGAAVLGALLPDIDHPQSWAGRKLPFISVPLAALVGHRGVTHSALAVLGMLALMAAGGLHQPAAPLAVGYLSHLLADGLTPSGVPLLWPSRRRFTLNLCRTGGVLEMLIVAAVAAAAAWASGLDPTHLPRPRLP